MADDPQPKRDRSDDETCPKNENEYLLEMTDEPQPKRARSDDETCPTRSDDETCPTRSDDETCSTRSDDETCPTQNDDETCPKNENEYLLEMNRMKAQYNDIVKAHENEKNVLLKIIEAAQSKIFLEYEMKNYCRSLAYTCLKTITTRPLLRKDQCPTYTQMVYSLEEKMRPLFLAACNV